MAHLVLKSGSCDQTGLLPDESQLLCGLTAFLAYEAVAVAKCISMKNGATEDLMPMGDVGRGFAVAFVQRMPTIRSVFQTAVFGIPGSSDDEDIEIKREILAMCSKYKTQAHLGSVFVDAFESFGIKLAEVPDVHEDIHEDIHEDAPEVPDDLPAPCGDDDGEGDDDDNSSSSSDEDYSEVLDEIILSIDQSMKDFEAFTSDSHLEMLLHSRIRTLIAELDALDFV
jgi:hypothetical protein